MQQFSRPPPVQRPLSIFHSRGPFPARRSSAKMSELCPRALLRPKVPAGGGRRAIALARILFLASVAMAAQLPGATPVATG